MKLRVGTSGFSYPKWKGSFYPEDLKASEMLHYYAERFSAVEINNSFYRLPTEATLAGWAGQVGADFQFSLKAPQRITHQLRLVKAEEVTRRFLDVAETLGTRLGPLLFQLPPHLKKDLPRLVEFLALLPPGRRTAFEFRHPSWLDAEVEGALRARGAALCWADTDEGTTPPVSTADYGYLRLRRTAYEAADLARWTDQIRSQPWREVYVYFKHEDAGTGPRFGRALVDLWGDTPSG